MTEPNDEFLQAWWEDIGKQLRDRRALAIAVTPAVVTYVLSAVGGAAPRGFLEVQHGATTPIEAAFGVAMITFSFGPLLLLMFGLGWSAEGRLPFMVWLPLSIVYGLPTLALAQNASWLPLIGLAVHVAMSERGSRLWTGVEYGAPSFCRSAYWSSSKRSTTFPSFRGHCRRSPSRR